MAATLYLPIQNAVSAEAVTQPMPQVSIPTPFQTRPVDWGPRWGYPTPRDGLHLETFDPPTYGPLTYGLATSPRVPPPIHYTFDTVSNRTTSDLTKTCPTLPIPLRNALETYNTKDGKHFGGYTEMNMRDVPSCSDLNGGYMNWAAFASQPWARAYVHQRPEVLTSDGRVGLWSRTIPRWIDERLHGWPVEMGTEGLGGVHAGK